MRFTEVEGKSKEDAIDKAARELGVTAEEIGIEVLSDSSRGFFGLGGRRLKVRAWSKRELQEQLHEEPEAPAPRRESSAEVQEDSDGSAKAEEARKALEGLLPWLSESATVEIRENNRERVLLEIHGDKTGLLIGKRGQTLDALQYLVNKMVNRNSDNAKRIEVDMEHYRTRREQSLRNMATRLGEKVKRKKKPITIEAMNAHDRRIIHLALKDDQSLETRSVGKGEMRKLVINLAQSGRSKGYEEPGVSS
jgi:spoIIIJ-associated protein